MPHRTLPAATLVLLLTSAAPPPALATDALPSRPISALRSAPGEIWSTLLSFIAFLGHTIDPDGAPTPDSGHGMDPNGTETPDSGHGMDPDGRDGLDSGHEMDPNG